ncbi:MAG: hypothetical protein GY751_16250 [Bacteroidetes bacterium]|nr:hypothetical protein [Bacteroidota bacterium]
MKYFMDMELVVDVNDDTLKTIPESMVFDPGSSYFITTVFDCVEMDENLPYVEIKDLGAGIGDTITFKKFKDKLSLKIFNPTDTPVDLFGLYISDDPENLTKNRIRESLLIEPDGYLTILAGKKYQKISEQMIRMDLKIKTSGEAAYLSIDGLEPFDELSGSE